MSKKISLAVCFAASIVISASIVQAVTIEVGYAYSSLFDVTFKRIYPMFRKASAKQDDQGVVTVNWCTRKDGVSQDSLMARHRTYSDGLTDDAAMLWWGIGYPSAGPRKGQLPG